MSKSLMLVKSTKSAKPSTVGDDFLTNASTVIDVAAQLGSVIPIPLVSSLISSAQVVVKAAQVRCNTITTMSVRSDGRYRYIYRVSKKISRIVQSLRPDARSWRS